MPGKNLSPAVGDGADLCPAARPGGVDHAGGPVAAVSGVAGGDLRRLARGGAGGVSPTAGPDGAAGAVSGGGGRASGGGGADGAGLRPARGSGLGGGPDFRVEVGPDGYAWWYVDAISDDGARAVSVIGFIGSVFSPWYRWSGRRHPQNHCCLNVVTSGLNGRFTMTDRGAGALRQSRDTLEIGPSRMHWTGRELVIDVDELGAPPMVTRVRGRIVVTPAAVTQTEALLTPDGRHLWRPFAPMAHVSVALSQGHEWEGHGYFDANFGSRALETDFGFWTWGRFPMRDRTLCFYDATRRDGSRLALAVEADRSGEVRLIEAPPPVSMARSAWLVRRETRADPGTRPRQALSLLDAPFYSRSLVRTRIGGEETLGMHEALDLARFRQPLMKPMLAVRVPRRARWP